MQTAGVSSVTQEWHTSNSDTEIIPPSTRENQTSMTQKPCFSQIGHIHAYSSKLWDGFWETPYTEV